MNSENNTESIDFVNSDDINHEIKISKNIVNKRAFVKSNNQLNFALNNVFYDSVVINKDFYTLHH